MSCLAIQTLTAKGHSKSHGSLPKPTSSVTRIVEALHLIKEGIPLKHELSRGREEYLKVIQNQWMESLVINFLI